MKKQLNLRVNPETIDKIKWFAQKWGLSQGNVLDIIVQSTPSTMVIQLGMEEKNNEAYYHEL